MNEQNLAAEIVLQHMTARLKAAGVKSAALDARLLLQALAGVSQTELLAGRAPPLDSAAQEKLAAAIERRLHGESVHRILGRRAFYGLDLALSPATLEPRPDSEAVIDLVLPLIRQKAADSEGARASRQNAATAAAKAENASAPVRLLDRSTGNFVPRKVADFPGAGTKQEEKLLPATAPVTLLDMGTGSGALALALLQEVPQLQAVGVDIAAEALATAQQNAVSAGLAGRFTTLKSDWFGAVTGRFDFIVSNPPYIPRADIEHLADEVRLYEPRRALDGGADGLDFYRALAVGAAAHLAPGGRLAAEAGFGQAAAIIALFQAAGFRHFSTKRDLAGIDRALLFAIA